MQYTLRNVPEKLDDTLRRRAREEGKSLNQVVVEALMQAFGLHETEAIHHRDLDDVAGTWVEDPAVEGAFADQRAIDEDLWT